MNALVIPMSISVAKEELDEEQRQFLNEALPRGPVAPRYVVTYVADEEMEHFPLDDFERAMKLYLLLIALAVHAQAPYYVALDDESDGATISVGNEARAMLALRARGVL